MLTHSGIDIYTYHLPNALPLTPTTQPLDVGSASPPQPAAPQDPPTTSPTQSEADTVVETSTNSHPDDPEKFSPENEILFNRKRTRKSRKKKSKSIVSDDDTL